jgi:hypothetical protein
MLLQGWLLHDVLPSSNDWAKHCGKRQRADMKSMETFHGLNYISALLWVINEVNQ